MQTSKQISTLHTPFELMYGRYGSYDTCIRIFASIYNHSGTYSVCCSNKEFPQNCDTSDMQFTQLEEPFDEDYIEEVFNRICFLRGNVFSD